MSVSPQMRTSCAIQMEGCLIVSLSQWVCCSSFYMIDSLHCTIKHNVRLQYYQQNLKSSVHIIRQARTRDSELGLPHSPVGIVPREPNHLHLCCWHSDNNHFGFTRRPSFYSHSPVLLMTGMCASTYSYDGHYTWTCSKLLWSLRTVVSSSFQRRIPIRFQSRLPAQGNRGCARQTTPDWENKVRGSRITYYDRPKDSVWPCQIGKLHVPFQFMGGLLCRQIFWTWFTRLAPSWVSDNLFCGPRLDWRSFASNIWWVTILPGHHKYKSVDHHVNSATRSHSSVSWL